MLRVHLFGGLALAWQGDPLPTVRGTVTRCLFAYLVTYRDRPHTRDLLAGTFWPDLPDANARRRLSKALWQIRQAFRAVPRTSSPDGQDKAIPRLAIFLTESDTVQLSPELPIWLDVEEFEQQVAGSRQQEFGQAVDGLLRASELYRGEFLAGYYLDWAVVERERLQEMSLEALGRLVVGYKGWGEYEPARTFARRLAAEEPWREEAHREVMRLCHLLGEPAEALKQFEACRQSLAEELGLEPSPETVALADEISTRSGLPRPPLLPSAARTVGAPLLERPDQLPLVGRRKELAELLRQLDLAVAGTGGTTIMYGEAGVGKSRLLRELADNARWRGVRTAWGRCYELAAPPAYQPLIEALRADLPALDGSALGPLWRSELSRLLPELATGERPPPPLPPQEEQRRLLEALTRGLLALADTAPTLVLLEDAQWMDAASLDALRYLLPRLGEAPLLVVVTARTEELAGRRAEALSAMESTRMARRLELVRLGQAETAELVQHALDLEEPAPRFSARLYVETEGNPFFLVETLWTLVEEGLLYRDKAGAWSTRWDESTEDYAELPLPPGVLQSIERRLDRLPGRLNDLLDLAAVVGRSLNFPLWCSASGRDEGTVLAAGDALSARGLLLASDPDYVFAHDQIRRVAYRRLAPPRRRLYHRRVAEALADLEAGEPAALAYHWTRAEVWDRALEYHRLAGDQARRVFANRVAIAHYSQALDAVERLPDCDPLLSYELHLAREAVLDLLAEREAQAEELQVLEALSDALQDDAQRAVVALRQAHYFEVTGDYAGAVGAAERALDLARASGDVGSEAACHRQIGRALWHQAKYESARPRFEEALALAQQTSQCQLEAESLRDLGNIAIRQGDYARAEDHYRAALRLCIRLSDHRGEGMVRNNLGEVLRRLGRRGKAMEHQEQSLRIRRQIGDRRGELAVLGNLGIAYHFEQDFAKAQACFEQTVQINRELGDRGNEALDLANLGSLYGELGAYPRARDCIDQSLRLAREIGAPHGEAHALSSLGYVLNLQGDYEEAREALEMALRLTRDYGARSAEANILTKLGCVYTEMGDLAGAAAACQRALELRHELSLPHMAVECRATLARIHLARGDLRPAQSEVDKVLAYLETGTLASMVEPLRVYLTCYQVLRANEDPRAEGILRTANDLLAEWASRIPDEELRRSFLENVPVHWEIVATYRRLRASTQAHRISIYLPRSGAPLGRPLREDEFLAVRWTVAAPEDETITNKVARRRQRILRLLHEAQAQGAAPTHSHLAEALGVSRRTIERDLATLHRQEDLVLPPTRGEMSE